MTAATWPWLFLSFMAGTMLFFIMWRMIKWMRMDRTMETIPPSRPPGMTRMASGTFGYESVPSFAIQESMHRPAEFGPLLRPQEDIERMRAAIIADQLAQHPESPKQRRRRLGRYQGETELDRVMHWLQQWQDVPNARLYYVRGVAA
jgi:hypothetical protein